MRIKRQGSSRLFEYRNRQVTADRRKVVKENFKGVAGFQVVKKRFDRDSCTPKHRRSTVDIWINGDQVRVHE
jgi:hypothetical protein